MQRLSPRLTLLEKIFPILILAWLGSWVVIEWWEFLTSFFQGATVKMEKDLIIAPLLFFIMSIFLLWLSGTLKRVYISGDELLVDNFFKHTRIPVSQIESVEGPDISSLRRITINLRSPSIFGSKIVFTAQAFQAKQTATMLRQKVNNQSYRG